MKFTTIYIIPLLLVGLFSCQNEEISTPPKNHQTDTRSIQNNTDFIAMQSLFEMLGSVDKEKLLSNIKNSTPNALFQTPGSHKSIFLNKEQLVYTYLGLSIKGSGGGGAYVDGVSVLKKILDKVDRVEIHDVSAADNDKLYVVAGGIGAPTALRKNLDGLIEAIKSAVFTLANIKGKKLGGVLSVESGSVNATIALLLSIELGVPLIDADGAGRAVPKLSNLTYGHETYSIAPTILASAPNPGAAVEVLHPTDPDNAEEIIRNTISKPEFGQMGGLALWAQSGRELKASSIVRNTYSEACTLGIYTFLSVFYSPSILDMYFDVKKTRIASFDGTLVDFNVKTKGGFDVTTLEIKLNNGHTASIYALNEDLLMKVTDGTLITAPHLISYTIQLPPYNYYYPLNNGDAELLKAAIGKKIHIITSYSNKRLYDFDDTFLAILKKAFGYYGPVAPPAPAQ